MRHLTHIEDNSTSKKVNESSLLSKQSPEEVPKPPPAPLNVPLKPKEPEPPPIPLKPKVPSRPYKERFRFIFETKPISLEGPIVNSIPSRVSWRHEQNHVEFCNNTYPFMLAIVPSGVANKDRRNTVRNTWAHPKYYKHTGIRAVFVLGATQDLKLQDEVDKEVKQYNDIIQNNFLDNYRNLTYKTMSWLTWVTKHCQEVPFVVKIDDDVIVNPFHLKKYLVLQLSKQYENAKSMDNGQERLTSLHRTELDHPATNHIYGKLETHPPPHRNDKWTVTR
ncbi:Beta-1,3-galactosyltransferase 5, partial [Halocaridina rubra]